MSSFLPISMRHAIREQIEKFNIQIAMEKDFGSRIQSHKG